MFRNALAVVAGYFVGSAINMGLIQLNMQVLFPPEAGLNVGDPEQFQAYIDALPVQALLVIVLAHLSQAFVGASVAARIAESRPMVVAMGIGALSLAGGVMAFVMIESPSWMTIELPLYLALAWAAGKLEEKRRARA